jgi:hypothetical protein
MLSGRLGLGGKPARACISGGGAEAALALKEERKRNRQLEKELRRKERALAEAAELLMLSRKLEAFRTEGKDGVSMRTFEGRMLVRREPTLAPMRLTLSTRTSAPRRRESAL